jgi:hypothetical protein
MYGISHLGFLLMILFANTLSNIGYLLAVVIMLTLLLRRSYRYFGRKGKRKIEGLVRIDRPAPAKRWSTNIDSPEQVAKFEVQLQETMRELSAQLDNKMVCLQVLLRQANEKIKLLEELQQVASTDESKAANDLGAVGEKLAAAGDVPNPLHQQIYELADQGFSAVTIAHRVAQPLREVEAILHSRHVS